MKLYGIDPLRIREHVIGSGTAISGLALGTEGPGQSQFIVTFRQFEFEPHPEGWEIVASTNGFPQVQANEAPLNPGWLVYLSSLAEGRVGKTNGRLLVSSANLEEVIVIGRGIGGKDGGLVWDEALLAITPKTLVTIMNLRTARPDHRYQLTPETVEWIPMFNPHVEDEFLRITDPQVPRWRRFRPHSEE